MQEELFGPLGMTSAGFGAPGEPADARRSPGDTAAPSRGPVEPGPNADNPPAIGPAGTVHASLADWAKYAALHLRGAQGRDRLPEARDVRADPGAATGRGLRVRLGPRRPPLGERPRAHAHGEQHLVVLRDLARARTRRRPSSPCATPAATARARATDEAIGALMAEVREMIPPQK